MTGVARQPSIAPTSGSVLIPPAPSLSELIRQHGSYIAIPPEAWIEFDRAMIEWDLIRRTHYGDPKAKPPKRNRKDTSNSENKGIEMLRLERKLTMRSSQVTARKS